MSESQPYDPPPVEGADSSSIDAEDRLLAFADRLRRSDDEEQEFEEKAETWVAFRLAASPYALPVSHVQEFAKIGKITRVPGAPSSVCGVASLRGQAIPIVDLVKHLGLAEGGDLRRDRALIVDHQGRRIGLVVDRVDRVFKLLPSLIKSLPAGENDRHTSSILGFYDADGVTFALLDADAS